MELAKISNVVLVVLQPTVKDISFAKNKISNLTKQGIETDKFMLVANRYKKWGSLLSLNDIKKALSRDTVYNIRSDWRKAVGAINQGKPICEIAPWSRLRKDYQKLVTEINNVVSHRT
jgi:Flp pilus assembly CpaE family ATPase